MKKVMILIVVSIIVCSIFATDYPNLVQEMNLNSYYDSDNCEDYSQIPTGIDNEYFSHEIVDRKSS